MPVKIALVGAGHMGRIHLGKLVNMADVDIIGVIDSDPSMRDLVAATYGVPCFPDTENLPGHPDGVIIATPTDTHHHYGDLFLRQGTHVFCEKPLASSPEEAEHLVSEAKERGLTLQVGHLERFNPAFTQCLGLIERPLLIEAHRLSSFTGRSVDIDVVFDLMIHDLDLVLSLAGSPVREIRGQGLPFLIDKLDAATVRLAFENGCVANISASRISVKKERSITVFEKDRYLFMDLLNCSLTVCTKDQEKGIETKETFLSRTDAVESELAEFISAIRNGTLPTVSGEDGLKAVIVANDITDHIAKHRYS